MKEHSRRRSLKVSGIILVGLVVVLSSATHQVMSGSHVVASASEALLFSEHHVGALTQPYDPEVADLDSDGDQEILVVAMTSRAEEKEEGKK